MNRLSRLILIAITLAVADSAWATALAANLDHGLILYYSFDQAGDYVEDLSGHDRHGTIEGATWVPDGVSGGAMYLVGPQHYIQTSDAGFPEGDAPRSFSWWFAITELNPSFCTDFMYYGTTQFNQANILGLDWRHGRNCPSFSQWGGVYLAGRRIDQTLTWHHLAFTYGGSGQYVFYINGERWHGHSELGNRLNTRPGGRFAIGSHSPDEVNSLGGFIDEVRIYDRMLTAGEVERLYLLDAEGAASKINDRSLRIAGLESFITPAVAEIELSAHSPTSNSIREHRPTSARASNSKTPPHFTQNQDLGGRHKDGPFILQIGFSDQPDGDQDVTVFYQGETLHVRIQDVDLAWMHEDLEFSMTLYQKGHNTHADIIDKILLEPDDQQIFRGEISLTPFRLGTVIINLTAVNTHADRIVFLRSAWITIQHAPPDRSIE